MRKSFASTVLSICLASASTFGIATAASAQTADAASSGGLEEIVVTAQRRSENLQSVPIAVTALTADAINKAGISGTNDLAVATPGLIMQVVRTTVQPFLRGVGTNDSSTGNESANALYVDGVYIANMPAGTFSLSNIERIEVLKGPQGTLFGRNSTGGLIQVITKKPSQDFHADLKAGYGNYKTGTGSFYVTGGLADGIAADLAGYYTKQAKGWGYDFTTGQDANKSREMVLRGKVLFEPSDDTSVTLSGDYDNLHSDVATTRQVVPGSILVGGVRYTGTYYDTFQALPNSGSHVQQGGGSARVEHEFGDVKFMSLSAYRKVVGFTRQDQDGTPANIVTGAISENAHNFSQEIQLSGDQNKLKWIVGAYYFDGKAGYTPLALQGAGISAGAAMQEIFRYQKTQSISGFGQATYEVLPATNLTLGGRYTSDKRVAGGGIRITPFATGISTFIPLNAEKTFTKFTYRAALDHKFGDAILVYASYSRGFKSGVFNLPTASLTPVNPETLDAAEVGFKSDLFDRCLRFNVAGFHYNYKNIQLSQTIPGGSALLNAAKARIYGIDMDVTAVPVHNFQLTAGLSLLNGKYTSFPNAPITVPTGVGGNASTSRDVSGERMIKSPKATVSINADYTVPLAEGELRLNGNFYHNSGFFWEPDHRIKQNAYNLVNSQIAWTTPNKVFTFTFWGRNLFNKAYAVTVSESALGDQMGPGAPRTYGGTVEARF